VEAISARWDFICESVSSRSFIQDRKLSSEAMRAAPIAWSLLFKASWREVEVTAEVPATVESSVWAVVSIFLEGGEGSWVKFVLDPLDWRRLLPRSADDKSYVFQGSLASGESLEIVRDWGRRQ
jgi:hypothetical protein